MVKVYVSVRVDMSSSDHTHYSQVHVSVLPWSQRRILNGVYKRDFLTHKEDNVITHHMVFVKGNYMLRQRNHVWVLQDNTGKVLHSNTSHGLFRGWNGVSVTPSFDWYSLVLFNQEVLFIGLILFGLYSMRS